MSGSDKRPSAVAVRLEVAALWLSLALVACYVSMFYGLESFGLVGPDEPRYAAVARDMAATGDWVTPRLNGEPWLEKPVLYYWVAGLGYHLIGNGETAARLPSALAALAMTLALGWLARQTHGFAAAKIVMVLLPTSVATIGFARAATPDMLFAATIALSMVAAASVVLPPVGRPSSPRGVAFGAALGMAVLAKGPAGIVLVGGSLLGWALMVGQPKRLLPLARPSGILAFFAVAVPWYALVALRNPTFFREFIVSHNVERFFTPVFRHEQPFWFFAPILLLGMVPWTPAAIGAVRSGLASVRTGKWAASPALYFVCWAVFPTVFFSLSKSKLPGYVLPVVPALALLLAVALADSLRTDDPTARWSFLGIGVVLIGLAVALSFPAVVARNVPGLRPELTLPLVVVLGAGGVLAAGASLLGRPLWAFVTVAATMAAFVWQINASIMPRLDATISARDAAHALAEMGGARDATAYRLHRAWQYGLDYYLQRRIPEWDRSRPLGSLVVTNDRGIRDLEAGGLRVGVLASVSDEAVVVSVGDEHSAPGSVRRVPGRPGAAR